MPRASVPSATAAMLMLAIAFSSAKAASGYDLMPQPADLNAAVAQGGVQPNCPGGNSRAADEAQLITSLVWLMAFIVIAVRGDDVSNIYDYDADYGRDARQPALDPACRR